MYSKKIKELSALYIPYILTLAFFLIFNLTIYKYLQNLKITNQMLILENYYTLLKDFLWRTRVVEQIVEKNNMKNTQMRIDQILPCNIEYRIWLNNLAIAVSKNYNQLYLFTKKFNINGNNFIIQLSYDNIISGEKPFDREIKKLIIISILSTFMLSVIYIFLYFVKDKEIKLTKKLYYETEKINQQLLAHYSASQKIKKMFIKKATSIYIDKILGPFDIAKHKETRYLFPLILIDKHEEEILVSRLVNLLTDYFAHHAPFILLRIETNIQKLKLNCGGEVFYQLIFSFIDNLIILMKEQTSISKILILEINSHEIKLSYYGYPINEKTLIKLSNEFQLNIVDTFFLSCERIFKSLKEHNFSYNLSHKDGFNIIEIFLNNALIRKDKNKTSAKIIKLNLNNGKLK